MFLAILGAGGDKDPVGATTRVLATLTDMVSSDGHKEPLRFTAALANGRDLYAFRYSANDNANTLYYRESERQCRGRVGAARFRPRPLEAGAARPHDLRARRGKPVTLEPFLRRAARRGRVSRRDCSDAIDIPP